MVAGVSMMVDEALAGRLSGIALGHVTREYPHALLHVMDGPGDARTPRELHPMFYGSFDWHSCVHGWWLLLRLLRRFPGHDHADAVTKLASETFTADKVAAELAYFERESARGFERPYGWAWLLALDSEAKAAVNHGWRVALAPLADAIAAHFRGHLPVLTYPIRTGSHANTAFALVLAADWASEHDHDLLALITARAEDWYGPDRDGRGFEPDGDAFLSPLLCEALLMARLLDSNAFRRWFSSFLPDAGSAEPAMLFQPPVVSDRSDGKIAHLDGLSLSRAWCWNHIAARLAPDDAARPVAQTAAKAHIEAGLPHISGDYAGEHWLATFALLALESQAESCDKPGD
jgi:hypothetical protein